MFLPKFNAAENFYFFAEKPVPTLAVAPSAPYIRQKANDYNILP